MRLTGKYLKIILRNEYSKEGRPAKPIRLIVGILLLKQIENLSDENVVLNGLFFWGHYNYGLFWLNILIISMEFSFTS
jgi:hypothetical protein